MIRIIKKRFERLSQVMVSLLAVASLLVVADRIWVTKVGASSPVPASTPVNVGWRGEYYANRDLAGDPVLVRTDQALDFDWGYNAPASSLPADEFSARWTGQSSFVPGLYRFHAVVDDGIRVYVDGASVLDDWRGGASRELTADRWLSAGTHNLRVEYYEHRGVALISLWWEDLTSYPDWRGEYWSNRNLDGNPALVRNDRVIDFDWDYGAPASGLPADEFSVRWTRQLSLEEALYRFHAVVDDGVRLYVDGTLIIDDWRGGAKRELVADHWLPAGNHDLRVEYHEHGGAALISLWWEKLTPYTDWKGEYWSNRSLDGHPALVSNDRVIDFDWGYGAPASGLPADEFSARWMRQLSFEEGFYRFHAVVDDGIRLYLDGAPVLDDWRDGPSRELTVERWLSAGNHDLRIEYYEHRGQALISLWWEKTTVSLDWKGEYWSNRSLDGYPALVRNDRVIDFDWGYNAPAAGLPRDNFSASWRGQLSFEEGLYRFHAVVDDGIRLYVDGAPVLDDWQDRGKRELIADRWLPAGNHDLRVEYYEHGGQALISLWWEDLTPSSDWKGEYWSNRDLDGYPALVRSDPAVSFNWEMGGPGGGIPSDDFSARWTRTIYFDGGTYRFHAWVDDGVRIWVGEQRIINAWSNRSLHEVTADYSLSMGVHPVKVEYYDSIFDAQINVWWERISSASYPEWKGRYWANRDLSGDPVLVRNDGELDFRWERRAPADGLPKDNFSARWTREVWFEPGLYRFYAHADDGVRLYIGNDKVLDEWHSAQDRTYTVDVFVAGERKLEVEFYEHQGDARLRLWWKWRRD